MKQAPLLHLCRHQIENHLGKKDVFTAVRLELHDKEFVPHFSLDLV